MRLRLVGFKRCEFVGLCLHCRIPFLDETRNIAICVLIYFILWLVIYDELCRPKCNGNILVDFLFA